MSRTRIPGPNAGQSEKLVCERAKYLGLKCQPLILILRVTQNVIVFGFRSHPTLQLIQLERPIARPFIGEGIPSLRANSVETILRDQDEPTLAKAISAAIVSLEII